MASASSSSGSGDALYTVPAVQRPTIEQLSSVAEALHLHISNDDLQQYRSIHFFSARCNSYVVLTE